MPRGRGFGPQAPKDPKPRTGGIVAGLQAGVKLRELKTAKDAAKLPAPKASPPLSNFKNLGGISGRK